MAAIAVVVLYAVHSSGVFSGGIIPGYEGLNAGVEGVNINSQFYQLGSALPYGYRWVNNDPRSMILGANLKLVLTDIEGQVRFETGDPQQLAGWSHPVDYWVKQPDGTYLHVKGEVVAYRLPITVSSRYTGGNILSSPYVFHGEKAVFGLVCVSWNRAVQEQSSYGGGTGYGQAWEAPLQVVVTSYNVDALGSHWQLDPSVSGRSITLYSTVQQTGTISQINVDSPNGTLSGDPRPDTRLSKTVYFSIVLTDFGQTVTLLRSYNPIANYELKVYALRLGKYTYTNIDDTPWGSRPQEGGVWEQFLNNIGSALGNLAEWLNTPMGFIALLGVFILVIVVALALSGALPILALGYSSRRD